MKARNRKRIKRFARRWGPVVALFVLPPILLHCAGSYEGIVRGIITFLIWTLGSGAFLRYGLSRKTRIIKQGGKINRPEYKNSRPLIELSGRVFFCLIGLLLLIGFVVPMALDVIGIASGGDVRIVQGKVDFTSSLWGSDFLFQSIYLRVDDHQQSYYLLYSTCGRLKRNRRYELEVLPRSKIVLEVHILPELSEEENKESDSSM